MKVLILGAGVIGVTTAYLLGERGHDVTVIDRGSEAASETSFANGGQLSFSHAEPWANPNVLHKAFKWMFQKDAPLIVRPRADWDMIKWVTSFLLNCHPVRSQRNAVSMLRLGMYSRAMMEKIRVNSQIEYDSLREGILHIYSLEQDFEYAIKQAEIENKSYGGTPLMEVMERNACLGKEPTLQHSRINIIGGIYCPMDESGDACTFTRSLSALCKSEFGTEFLYNTEVRRLTADQGRITQVETDKGALKADAYVMALGSYSPLYLKKIGIHIPVYPMKGYSISVPVGQYAPSVSLTDNEHKIVITRLGDRLRVAGTAEFAGYNDGLREDRLAPIITATQKLFPHADYSAETMAQWACLRPSTPDGPPVIGQCKYDNLFLNTGHGTLGWTQAAGSAALIADIIDGRETEISLNGLTIDRY